MHGNKTLNRFFGNPGTGSSFLNKPSRQSMNYGLPSVIYLLFVGAKKYLSIEFIKSFDNVRFIATKFSWLKKKSCDSSFLQIQNNQQYYFEEGSFLFSLFSKVTSFLVLTRKENPRNLFDFVADGIFAVVSELNDNFCIFCI